MQGMEGTEGMEERRAAFEPSRLESLIYRVVRDMGRDLGGIELAKIIYLIDVEKARFTGETVTREEYVRAQKGPLARNFRSSIRRLRGHEIDVARGKRAGSSSKPKDCHRTGPSPRFEPAFDAVDDAIIGRVLARIQDSSPIELECEAYATEPMQTVIVLEASGAAKHRGVLDLGLVRRDERFAAWKRGQHAVREPDPKYEAFLEQEKREAAELLRAYE